MTTEVQKLDRNNRPVKTRRMKSNVENFEDIVWKKDTGNPYIDSVIEHDGFNLSVIINNTEYELKSPKYKLMTRFKRFAIKEEREGLSDLEKYEMDGIQSNLVENIIDGFILEDYDEMTEQEYTWLSSLCWRYVVYDKKKSSLQRKDFI